MIGDNPEVDGAMTQLGATFRLVSPRADRSPTALVPYRTAPALALRPGLEIDLSQLPLSAVVVDIVYVPLETALLAAARRRGHRVVDGVGMLLHQVRPGFEAWFGAPVRVTRELRAAVLTTLSAAR